MGSCYPPGNSGQDGTAQSIAVRQGPHGGRRYHLGKADIVALIDRSQEGKVLL